MGAGSGEECVALFFRARSLVGLALAERTRTDNLSKNDTSNLNSDKVETIASAFGAGRTRSTSWSPGWGGRSWRWPRWDPRICAPLSEARLALASRGERDKRLPGFSCTRHAIFVPRPGVASRSATFPGAALRGLPPLPTSRRAAGSMKV